MGRKVNAPNIKIVKVPLGHKQTDLPKKFPKMPRMYLELLENKAKVRPDLVNTEYSPDPKASRTQENPKEEQGSENIPKSKSGLLDRLKELPDTLSSPTKSGANTKEHFNLDSPSGSQISESEIDDEDMSMGDIEEGDLSMGSDDGSVKSAGTEDVEVKLRRMLDNKGGKDGKSDFSDFQSTVSNKYKKGPQESKGGNGGNGGNGGGDGKLPPTLKQLEQAGGYIPKKEAEDIGKPDMTEQEEEDMKRELLFKFELLKKKYPESSIPDYTVHSSYSTMKKTYDMAVRRLSLDSSVESYKTYLLLGFAACEYGLGVWGGFDVSGFTRQQMSKMSSYETLLIEMGEKSYTPDGSNWPVEVRLVCMIIMNAAMFIITKQIMKKAGGALGNIFGMGDGNPQPSPTPKRRMNGPDIDLDSIP